MSVAWDTARGSKAEHRNSPEDRPETECLHRHLGSWQPETNCETALKSALIREVSVR